MPLSSLHLELLEFAGNGRTTEVYLSGCGGLGDQALLLVQVVLFIQFDKGQGVTHATYHLLGQD